MSIWLAIWLFGIPVSFLVFTHLVTHNLERILEDTDPDSPIGCVLAPLLVGILIASIAWPIIWLGRLSFWVHGKYMQRKANKAFERMTRNG